MSLISTPLHDAPYAAAVHAVELGDFGASFRPIATTLFSCPIAVDRLVMADERDELRALLRAAPEH